MGLFYELKPLGGIVGCDMQIKRLFQKPQSFARELKYSWQRVWHGWSKDYPFNFSGIMHDLLIQVIGKLRHDIRKVREVKGRETPSLSELRLVLDEILYQLKEGHPDYSSHASRYGDPFPRDDGGSHADDEDYQSEHFKQAVGLIIEWFDFLCLSDEQIRAIPARPVKYALQRASKRGWSDDFIFRFDRTFMRLVPEVLSEYLIYCPGYPYRLEEERASGDGNVMKRWLEILRKMIRLFHLGKTDPKARQKALTMFFDWYEDFWR